MSAPNPFDMNAAISAVVQHELGERTPLIIAQALLTAGNNLRGQAFAMTAGINVAQFATPPKQLADGSAIVLLTALKYVPGSYRLFVSPVKLDDGTTVRSTLIVDENEADLLQTKFLNLSDESKAELARQLDAVQLPADGTIELCLAIVNQPIDGYTYWVDPNAPAAADPDANPPADAASTDTPAAADGSDTDADATPAAAPVVADAAPDVAADPVVDPTVPPAASAGGSVADVTSTGATAADAASTPTAAATTGTASDTGAGSVADVTSTGGTAADATAATPVDPATPAV